MAIISINNNRIKNAEEELYRVITNYYNDSLDEEVVPELEAAYEEKDDSLDPLDGMFKTFRETKEEKNEDIEILTQEKKENQEKIYAFISERNEESKQKMYGDAYVLSDRHFDSSDVDSIVREFKGHSTILTMEEKIYKVVLDYVEWVIEKKATYMFDTTLDIHGMSVMIVDSLKKDKKKIFDEIYTFSNFSDYDNLGDKEFFDFIHNFIKNKVNEKNDVKLKKEFNDVRNYILKYIRDSKRYEGIPDYHLFVDDVAFDLADELLSKGAKLKDIKNGICLSYIDSELRKDAMRRKSVSNDSGIRKFNDDVKEIKLTIKNFFRNKIARNALAIVLGILIFSNSSPGIAMFEGIADLLFPSQYSETVDELRDFDNYDYPLIQNSEDKNFAATYYHLVDIFPKYAKYDLFLNDNYEQICLYEAYKSIDNIDPSMMDSLLNMMCGYYQNNGDIASESLLYDNATLANSTSMSYPVYVYIAMHEAGIDVGDYANAVKAYSEQIHNVSGTTYDSISPQYQKDIKKMMKEYGKFIEQLENKFINLPNIKDKGVSKWLKLMLIN